jgi:peptidoglycan biosynthesis protein MviN/MurJ (putative lipid II flippase)
MKQNKKKHHKMSQVQMQYSFSKFFSMQVLFGCCLIKGREEKKRVWRQFCEWLSEAAAHLLAVVSLLLLEALFVQISEVILALTWPCRLCLLRVLCASHCYKLSTCQAHWGR